MKELQSALDDATMSLTSPQLLAATKGEMNARDWAAFFESLAKFIGVLLPLILPLFTEKEPK